MSSESQGVLTRTHAVWVALKRLGRAGHVPYNRLGGDTRYQTANKVAEHIVGLNPRWVSLIGPARGDKWVYAVCGGVAAGNAGGLMDITAPTSLSGSTKTFLESHSGHIDNLTVIGDGRSPTDAVVKAARGAASVK
jgi:hypothetical protein